MNKELLKYSSWIGVLITKKEQIICKMAECKVPNRKQMNKTYLTNSMEYDKQTLINIKLIFKL